MSTETVETELKFTVSDRTTFKFLRNLPQIGPFMLQPLGTKRVADQYLDTADLKFFRAGYACRIRRDKKKLILTLKSLTPAEGHLHRREELETVIPSTAPETWPANPATERARAIAAEAPLSPLFAITQQRHQFHVMENDQPVIELSLDQVTAGAEKYFELEAELLTPAPEETLHRFAAALQSDCPLEPSTQSKFERALAQLSPARPASPEAAAPVEEKPEAAPPRPAKRKSKKITRLPVSASPGLDITDSFAEAGRKVFYHHFAQMLKAERGLHRRDEIEDLHDMRVAIRRLRAAFRLFGPGYKPAVIKPLLGGLKATGRALGPVRDLDVFMEHLQHYQLTLPPEEQPEFQNLLDTWQAKRAAAQTSMLAYLDSRPYQQFKQALHTFVTTPGLGVKSIAAKIPPAPTQVRHIAPGLIYQAYDQVRAYETVIEDAPISTLHQLRITFKGLRYTLEFFKEILGEGKELVIEDVKIMQEHLGNLNDANVAITLLQEFLESWDEEQTGLAIAERQNPAPIAAYLSAQMQRRHSLLTTFPEAWTYFNRPELRRSLALAISGL
jgi:CHAD domain-containing protein/uncharacterized protein YjbK